MLVSGLRAFQFLGRRHALVLQGGNAARIDRLGDQRDGDAEVLRGDDRPFAGAFLAGGVEDLVHQRLAVGVLEGEDVAGDLDEVGVEFALVPFGEDLVHLVGGQAQAVLHQVVGLADELHVAVFDAVVDHLHVMAGAVFAHPIAAGRRRPRPWRRCFWKMSFTCGQAAGEPPGMMLGPWRAPSSPPETPVPM